MASGMGRESFVVACQATVEHQPAERPLCCPALRCRVAPWCRWCVRGSHGDTEGGGVRDEVLAVPSVRSDFADPRVVGGDPVDQLGANNKIPGH